MEQQMSTAARPAQHAQHPPCPCQRLRPHRCGRCHRRAPAQGSWCAAGCRTPARGGRPKQSVPQQLAPAGRLPQGNDGAVCQVATLRDPPPLPRPPPPPPPPPPYPPVPPKHPAHPPTSWLEPRGMTKSMTSCSLSRWSISSRLVTRPMRSRPTLGATSATASTISLCSSALERLASLPPWRKGGRGEEQGQGRGRWAASAFARLVLDRTQQSAAASASTAPSS